jgi:tRNA (guanine-N7-)-methyltransferase
MDTNNDNTRDGLEDDSGSDLNPGSRSEFSSDFRPEYRKKAIRSYVLRAGRMTEGQRKAFSSGLSFYGLKLDDGLIDAEAIFGR